MRTAGYTSVDMDQQATYDDVNLIVKLYELRREERMRKARKDVGGLKRFQNVAEFQAAHPMGSQVEESLRMVTSYWNMVASFVTSGVLNKELFAQNCGELLFTWEKIKDLVPETRQMFNNPKHLSHMEAGAKLLIDEMNRSNPKAYEVFSARVKAMSA
jgi:hypothetical protein